MRTGEESGRERGRGAERRGKEERREEEGRGGWDGGKVQQQHLQEQRSLTTTHGSAHSTALHHGSQGMRRR